MRRQAVVQKEWILLIPIEAYIKKEVEELHIRRAALLAELFKNGCETAYIVRYREDVHGGMKPERIRRAKDAYLDALELNAKVTAAISTITEKVPGMDEKRAITYRLKRCEDFVELAVISKEFSTGSSKTKADVARELGLETPAKSILDGNYVNFSNFVSKDLKTEKEVAEHTKILLADMLNQDVEVRKVAVNIAKLETNCNLLVTAKLTNDAMKKKKELEEKNKKLNMMMNNTGDEKNLLNEDETNFLIKCGGIIGKHVDPEKIQNYTISALNRGEEENIVTWKVECQPGSARHLHPFARKNVYWEMRSFFRDAVNYSVVFYFVPMIERGVKRYLVRNSQDRAISVFAQNVEQLFCQHGVRSKYVIALDPGSTVKAAFLEPTGKVIEMNEFFMRDSTFENRGVALLKNWSAQTMGKDIVFAIGNGSKTYSTQKAVSKLIEKNEFHEGVDVCFCIVPEHGASKYSCTDAAREEFGDEAEIKQVSAVSIGRRLIDPMSEYVKIEPQHLGKGQYQQSISSKLLRGKVVDVVRDRVSLIGADVNLASEALLKNICGLNKKTAAEIVKYREQNGRIRSREELKRVRGIGEITFQQCSGFLTVSPPDDDSPAKRFKGASSSTTWSPLDQTIVHPDDYEAATKMLKKFGLTVAQIKNGMEVPSAGMTFQECRIWKQLTEKPQLKPPPTMMKTTRNLNDLKTDFGIFVDLGVERDGLVHISHFIRYPPDKDSKKDVLEGVPSVGDQIEVIIKQIEDNRISLDPVKNESGEFSSNVSA